MDLFCSQKLRKAGYTIPDSAGKVSGVPAIQEVAKIDLAGSGISIPAMMEQSTSLQSELSEVSGIPSRSKTE